MSSPYGTGPRSCDEEYLANQFNDLFKPPTPAAVRVEPHVEVQIQAILPNRTFWDDMPMGRSPLSDVANKLVNLPTPSFVAPVSRKACTYNGLATEARDTSLAAPSPSSSRQNAQREEYAKLRKARVMTASPHDSPTPQPRHALVQAHSPSLMSRRSSPPTPTVSARRVSFPARQPPRFEHQSQPLSKPSQSIRQPLQAVCKPPHPAPARSVPSALSSGNPIVDAVLTKAAEKAAFNREAKQIRKIRAEAAAKGLRIPTEDELRKASNPSAALPCRLPLAAISKQRLVSAPFPRSLPVPAPFLQQEMSKEPSAASAKRIPNPNEHPTLAFSPYRPTKSAFQPIENRAYSPGIEILSSPPVASKSIFERGLTGIQLRNIALYTPVGNKENERTGAQRTVPVQVKEKEKMTVKLFNEERKRSKEKEKIKDDNESKVIVKDEPSPVPSILVPNTVIDSPLPSPPPSPPVRNRRLPSESSPKVLPIVAPVPCSLSLPTTSKTHKKIIPVNRSVLVDVDVHVVSLASGPVKTDERTIPSYILSPSPSARPIQSASPSSISADSPQSPALREPEDMDTEDTIPRPHLVVAKENMEVDVDPFDSCLERQAPSIYELPKVKEMQPLRSANVKRSLAMIWFPQLRSNASRVVASGLSASKLFEAKALEVAISRVSTAGRYFPGLRCTELLSGALPVQRKLAVNGKVRWAKRAAGSEFVQTREVPSAFSKSLPEPLVPKQRQFSNDACYSVGVWRGFSLR